MCFMLVSMFISIYLHTCLCASLHIYYLCVMHELRGSFLDALLNPCIYNFMSFVIIKKGEIVGPKAHHSSFDDDQLM